MDATASIDRDEAFKAISRRYFIDLLNDKHYEQAPDIFTPDAVLEPHGLKGPDGMVAWVKSFHAAFSDAHDEILGQWVAGDRVFSHIRFTGTHDGPWKGQPPTYQRLEWCGMGMHTIRDGKIAGFTAIIDMSAAFRQLGWLTV